jgi:hypothetical protein
MRGSCKRQGWPSQPNGPTEACKLPCYGKHTNSQQGQPDRPRGQSTVRDSDWDDCLPDDYRSPSPFNRKWEHGYGAQDTMHACWQSGSPDVTSAVVQAMSAIDAVGVRGKTVLSLKPQRQRHCHGRARMYLRPGQGGLRRLECHQVHQRRQQHGRGTDGASGLKAESRVTAMTWWAALRTGCRSC